MKNYRKNFEKQKKLFAQAREEFRKVKVKLQNDHLIKDKDLTYNELLENTKKFNILTSDNIKNFFDSNNSLLKNNTNITITTEPN